MGIATLWPLYEGGEIVPATGIIFTTFGVMLVIVAIINLELLHLIIGLIMINGGFLLYFFGMQFVRKKREEKRKQDLYEYHQYQRYLQSQHRSQYRTKKNNGRYRM